jgi:hypothetical protein
MGGVMPEYDCPECAHYEREIEEQAEQIRVLEAEVQQSEFWLRDFVSFAMEPKWVSGTGLKTMRDTKAYISKLNKKSA